VITTIKTGSVGAYRALFDEAADILSGYKKVNTYVKNTNYFYKDREATSAETMYVLLPDINSPFSFTKALADHGALYAETGSGVANGFNPMLGITTLEEYFSWMRTLGNISRKYTMLPLDEPHFVINTNTRAITIPADFKKNGIAV
jgi:hypothetical protein